MTILSRFCCTVALIGVVLGVLYAQRRLPPIPLRRRMTTPCHSRRTGRDPPSGPSPASCILPAPRRLLPALPGPVAGRPLALDAGLPPRRPRPRRRRPPPHPRRRPLRRATRQPRRRRRGLQLALALRRPGRRVGPHRTARPTNSATTSSAAASSWPTTSTAPRNRPTSKRP